MSPSCGESLRRAQVWIVGFGICQFAIVVQARKPRALSITPSTDWFGDDGRWSAITLRVGSDPQQWVNLIPSTTISETWLVSRDGCAADDSLCASSRGGLFDHDMSKSWAAKGFYNLGINTPPATGAYGYYGSDRIEFGTTGISLPDAMVAVLNETAYWVPFFGLGIVPGDFDGSTPKTALSALVEDVGAIPSHTYGFTAGASYQQKSSPLSLTLGGYDQNRFVAHDTSFTLTPSLQPEVFVASVALDSQRPLANSTNSIAVLDAGDGVKAIVDSSTPFLWLPQSVCDRLAAVLGLVYDSALELYTFGKNGTAQRESLRSSRLNITFSLSDLAMSTDTVNITLPFAAFDLLATYPFIENTTFGAANASVAYFPLKVSPDANTHILGRSFLQEAYIITDYERNNFSIHQAVHTGSALSDTDLVDIARFEQSRLQGPPEKDTKLSPGAIAGTVIAVLLACIVAVLCAHWCRKRARDKQTESKGGQLALSKYWQALCGSRPRRHCSRLRSLDEEKSGLDKHTESGSGSQFGIERFELPAPPQPVELDSGGDAVVGPCGRKPAIDSVQLRPSSIESGVLGITGMETSKHGQDHKSSSELRPEETVESANMMLAERTGDDDPATVDPTGYITSLFDQDTRSMTPQPPIYNVRTHCNSITSSAPSLHDMGASWRTHTLDNDVPLSPAITESSSWLPSEPSSTSSEQSDMRSTHHHHHQQQHQQYQQQHDDVSSVSELSQTTTTTTGRASHQQRDLDDLAKFRKEDFDRLLSSVEEEKADELARHQADELARNQADELARHNESLRGDVVRPDVKHGASDHSVGVVHEPRDGAKRYSWE